MLILTLHSRDRIVIEVPDQRGDLRRVEVAIALSDAASRVKLAMTADPDVTIRREERA